MTGNVADIAPGSLSVPAQKDAASFLWLGRAFVLFKLLFSSFIQTLGALLFLQGFVFGFSVDSVMHFTWRLSSQYVESETALQLQFRITIGCLVLGVWAIILLTHALHHYSSKRRARGKRYE